MASTINFSVVIPAYNCEATISATLDSVRSQSYPVSEIIVVNDGSSDKTAEILSNESNIRVIDQKNAGVSHARNAGIKACQYDYIAFVDADDIWLPDKIENIVRLIELHPNAIGYYTYFHPWFEKDESKEAAISGIQSKQQNYNIECDWIYHKQLITNHVLTSTAVVRRTALADTGLFDTELPVAEDWDLMLRLSRKGLFCKIEKPLTLYKLDHDSLTSTIKTRDFASAVVNSAIVKYGYQSPDGQSVNIKDYKQRAYRRHLEYGALAYKSGQFNKAYKAFTSALTKKITVKCFIYLVLSGLRK